MEVVTERHTSRARALSRPLLGIKGRGRSPVLFRATLAGLVFVNALFPQTPAITSVLNGMSYQPQLSPGVLASVRGTNLAGAGTFEMCGQEGGYKLECAGVSVRVNDRAAALNLVSPTELTLQLPVELQAGPATIQVQRRVGQQVLLSDRATVSLQAHAPAVATANAQGNGPIAAFGNRGWFGPTNPAWPGEEVFLYATGLGTTNPVVATGTIAPDTAPCVTEPSLTVGGREAEVLYAGMAPRSPVFYQVTFRLPGETPLGLQPVILEIGGFRSQQNVTLPVAAPRPAITGVRNSASGSPIIAAGSWVAIYGWRFTSTSRIWREADFDGRKLPMSLDGVSVKVDGKSAAVYYVSPTQINVLAPSQIAPGEVRVEVTNAEGTVGATALARTYSPAWFAFSPANSKYIAAVHVDGVFVGSAGLFQGAAVSRPARPGDTILLFGTGFGPTNPPVPADEIYTGAAPLSDVRQLTIRLGNVAAEVQFAGMVGAGLYQFNVVVPDIPTGDQPVIAEVADAQNQAQKFITVQR